MPYFSKTRTVLAATLALTLPSAALAQDAEEAPSFRLELNGAAQTEDGSCRLTYVASNQTGQDLDRASYQVGVFDLDGVVTRLVALEFGSMVEGKTKILRFDLSGQACETISRIIVNDVVACTASDGSGESAACIGGLAASSRTAIQFGI